MILKLTEQTSKVLQGTQENIPTLEPESGDTFETMEITDMKDVSLTTENPFQFTSQSDFTISPTTSLNFSSGHRFSNTAEKFTTETPFSITLTLTAESTTLTSKTTSNTPDTIYSATIYNNNSSASTSSNIKLTISSQTITTERILSTTNSQTTKTSTNSITTTLSTTKAPLFCVKDGTLFSNQGHLVDADSYGQWVEACELLYLWGNKVVDWQSNHDRCCSIGMMPIMIENDKKRECLTSLANSSEWKFGINYWSYGRKFRESANYLWCQQNSIIENNSSLWKFNSTKQSDGCVHLFINKRVSITSENCSKLYIFGCQGQTTQAPPCYKPQCPNISCEKNQSLFTKLNYDGIYQVLLAPSNQGYWYTINSRTYMFSYTDATWFDAMTGCCSIGMKLLSIEYDYEYGNLVQAAKNSSNATGTFWTSGSDLGCDKNFAWCSANVLFRGRQTSWGPGEPNNLRGKEHCVVVQLNKTSGILFDSDCSSKLKYICEARDTRNTNINAEAILHECGMIYNVSDVEASDIFNRKTKLTLILKCFLKCMGENGGFMWNGKLIDAKVLTMIEKYSNNELELQEYMAAHQACGSERGMDDCDTASLIFQCTQDQAPKLFENILTEAKNNPLAEFVPLQTTVHKCVTNYSCVIDPILRDDYVNNRSANGNQIFTACGIKYLHFSEKVNLLTALTICCKYGLKLASIESVTEVECIVNSSLNLSVRSSHTWTSASRLGSGKYGWCSSDTPFNLSPTIIDKYPERSSIDTIFLLAIRFGVDMNSTNTYLAQEDLTSLALILCKP
ncbi:uncharacterized protein LOC132195490 [Neocloeon triangulifer]|uniref:uncharacterized protein LOC132195490 n=1 Tax=Neocloeon triangulifer TaxID=2078957 RepID=UPI00286F6B47|nr:uncharacterized protein LOC132195490 [Neocloeon triangulifer]